MTAPLTTPLILASAFNAATGQAEPTRLLEQIIIASSLLQGACHRRFDEYVATNRYTAQLVVDRGDLIDWYRLSLGADLKSVSAIATDIPFGGVIGSGTAVTTYDILMGEDGLSGRELALDSWSDTSFIPTGNPRKSIGLTGVWGFGGQWVNSGATVSGLSASAAATAATVSSATNIEVGQVWRIGTEYLYANTLATTTATVDRAYNGSTAAVHPDGTAIYYWQAHPLVQGLITRMIQWSEIQKESPMSGSIVVGDFQYPVDNNGLPKDVFDTIYRAGLVALPERIVKA